jgi:acetyltransferase-like isoleucine patch superfamily enzyme
MIHPSALISPKAKIHDKVTIGAFCIVHENVEILAGTSIDSYSEIGIKTGLAKDQILLIGENSVIRSHATIYIGSKIGSNLQTGHYVSIRENSDIGHHCQIGSRGDIQGDCSIGNYTKLHIGKKSKVGNYVWMFPEVLLTNDPTPPSYALDGPTIKDFVVLAAKVLVFPGVIIEKGAVISASSVVKQDVPAGKLMSGNPAKVSCDASIIRMHDNPKEKAYPWRKRFHRGYSEKDIATWLNE